MCGQDLSLEVLSWQGLLPLVPPALACGGVWTAPCS